VRSSLAALALILFLTPPIARATELGSPASAARYAPAADPLASVAAYRTLLAADGDEPALELFTPASRVLRKRRPFSPEERRAAAERLPQGVRLQVRKLRDRAVVAPVLAQPGTLPLLLHQIDGTWRIDQVEMEKALGLDVDGSVLQRDDATPYAFAIEGRSTAMFSDLGSADLFGEDPGEAIARLEAAQPKTAGIELRLAEILLRNCWLVDEALPHYREALRLAPEDWRVADTYGRRALFLGIGDEALPVLEPFGPRADSLIGQIHLQAKRFREGHARTLRPVLRRWRENQTPPAEREREPSDAPPPRKPI
jgi:hypothetical protein